jgi:receptor expression-enhancing protein 5/6
LSAAYFTFKALEHKGAPDVRNWAVYWTILALFTCTHSLLDCTLCWLPGYYFLKLGFMAALWHPNMQMAVWLYERSVGPLLGSYEVRLVVLSSVVLFDVMLCGDEWHCCHVLVC